MSRRWAPEGPQTWSGGPGGRATWLVVVLLLVAAVVTAPAGAGSGPPRYRPPLDAPVVDPFRPPAEPWLAGNRGLEYETIPGTPVGSVGPGLVVFAGPVAGQLYVTVLHPDGIRSSYSYLAAVSVAVGDRVRTGDVVGTTGAVFHLGARVGDDYIDPAALFGTVVGKASVFLVPSGPGPVPGPQRSSSPDPTGPTRPGPRPTAGEQVRRSVAPLPALVAAAVVAGVRVAVAGSEVAGPMVAPASLGAPGSASLHSFVGPPAWCATYTPSPGSTHGRRSGSCRLGVGSGLRRTVGRGEVHDAARRDHEAVARGRGPLRSPDPSLEPQDEAVHLR